MFETVPRRITAYSVLDIIEGTGGTGRREGS
jgi:hypothetical protein